MSSTSPQLRSDVEDLSTGGLLAAAKGQRAAADAAEARVLAIAVAWADAHPAESIADAATFPMVAGAEEAIAIAGPGCPLVAEFCLPELGAALGMSTVSARYLVGQALELRHRLPKLWAAVHAGRLPAWRARKAAERTIAASPELPLEAARWVDAQVAPYLGKCSLAQVDRLIAEAIRRFDLAPAPGEPGGPSDPDPDAATPDRRHVTVETDEVGYDGTVEVTASLDLADAHDLNHAVADGAATLKALGSTEGLDGRRASALGDLARRQLSLDLAGQTSTAGATAATAADAEEADRKLPKARQVVLHVHAHAAFGDPAGERGFATAVDGLLNHRLAGVITGGIGIGWDPLVRLEEGHHSLLLDQVKEWCRDTHTKVTIQPVLDTAATITAPGYRIPDRLRTQITLRDQTCVFPFCTTKARRCQVDHITPYDHDADADGRPQPGPTTSNNLAALCAFHHRLKTHGRWRYSMLAPGVFEWTSPHGHRFHRDRTGTTPIKSTDDGTPPTPPSPPPPRRR